MNFDVISWGQEGHPACTNSATTIPKSSLLGPA